MSLSRWRRLIAERTSTPAPQTDIRAER
jgi:hypothetical protein